MMKQENRASIWERERDEGGEYSMSIHNLRLGCEVKSDAKHDKEGNLHSSPRLHYLLHSYSYVKFQLRFTIIAQCK